MFLHSVINTHTVIQCIFEKFGYCNCLLLKMYVTIRFYFCQNYKRLKSGHKPGICNYFCIYCLCKQPTVV